MRKLCKEGISCQGWTERKRLAKLLVNKKIIGPVLRFLKSTEVGTRKRTSEKEEEWERRNDQAGEKLLED